MTNSKAQRDKVLREAGAKQMPDGSWRFGEMRGPTCFTCKSCWRRSLQSDLDDLRCPFCGSAMYEVRK